MTEGGLFLDTTIVIGGQFREGAYKARIRRVLGKFENRFTSLVCRREYVRRVLKDVAYLLRAFDKCGSFAEVGRRVQVLPVLQSRKFRICLAILSEAAERASEGSSEPERDERIKRYLRTVIVAGSKRLPIRSLSIIDQSKCSLAAVPVRELKPYVSYDFGPKKTCSAYGESCGVERFLIEKKPELERVLSQIKTAGEAKTKELARAEQFIEGFLRTGKLNGVNPCDEVGDLLIALESATIDTFYTANSAESAHLCRALGQTLIVRPNNPENDDRVFASADQSWPPLETPRTAPVSSNDT